MNRPQTCVLAFAALVAVLPTSILHGAVVVVGTVTPLGGSYRYEASVENTDAVNYLFVSLMDAPPGDPLINPSLTAPAGFLASYDSGWGIVDLLADADEFAAGTTVGMFSFESLTPPSQGFAVVQTLDTNLQPGSGTARWTVIPEPATVGTAVALGLLAGVLTLRRRGS
jgi:hypothetical protein